MTKKSKSPDEVWVKEQDAADTLAICVPFDRAEMLRKRGFVDTEPLTVDVPSVDNDDLTSPA